jgi:hypothetical protein
MIRKTKNKSKRQKATRTPSPVYNSPLNLRPHVSCVEHGYSFGCLKNVCLLKLGCGGLVFVILKIFSWRYAIRLAAVRFKMK